ncbi:uncharacterized protein LOC125683443 isoform X2 [Ostrea edulis]|uniref:uncharacterized protein LOC125683443 isoform X2 n=1 Tax=Ostrea edulis TaxID=37623 RepID=UPI0024AE90F6|nr:uncharacterized protein LOC125683443 isoform X2 [Ostrea edulis]
MVPLVGEHRLNNYPHVNKYPHVNMENTCNNCTCCCTDEGQCPNPAPRIYNAVIIACCLLFFGIILFGILIYLLNKRWRIGTAPWKYSSAKSSLNIKQYLNERGNTPSNESRKAGKDCEENEEEILFNDLKPYGVEQSSCNRIRSQNTASNKYDYTLFRGRKQKSCETVDSDFSVVGPIAGTSQESTLTIENEFQKEYDYASSLMVQELDRTSDSLPEGKMESPLPDQRGKTVRKIRSKTYSKQEVVKPPNPRRSKFPSPPWTKRSTRQKKTKSKKVDETEYVEWSTCNTNVINCTRNLNDECLNPTTVRNRSNIRSMSLDTACLMDRKKSDDAYGDSDSDDEKEEFTPQLTWYIQKLKAKHLHLLKKSHSVQVNTKFNNNDMPKNKTLGSKSSQSLGVRYLLDKTKNASTMDNAESRPSADYLTLMDVPSQNKHDTILEEAVDTANDDLSRSENVAGAVKDDLVKSEEIMGVVKDDLVRSEEIVGVVEEDLAKSEEIVGVVKDDLISSEEIVGVVKDDLVRSEEIVGVVKDDLISSEEIVGVVKDDLVSSEEIVGVVKDDLVSSEEIVGVVKNDLIKSEEIVGVVKDDLAKKEEIVGIVKDDIAKSGEVVCVTNDDLVGSEEVACVSDSDMTEFN